MSGPTKESLAEAREIIGMLEPDSRVPILARRLDELKAERDEAVKPWRVALRNLFEAARGGYVGLLARRIDEARALLAAKEEV